MMSGKRSGVIHVMRECRCSCGIDVGMCLAYIERCKVNQKGSCYVEGL